MRPPGELVLSGEGEMNMKAFAGLAALLFATSAFAQSAQPVKGTKLWAGDCMDAAALRGVEPTAETTPPALPAQAGAAIPPGQTQ